MDEKQQYWALANLAIWAGIITRKQAKTIARVGTRKERYWVRHVRDLQAFIGDKLDGQEARSDGSRSGNTVTDL